MYQYTGLLYNRPVRRDLVSKEKRPTVARKDLGGRDEGRDGTHVRERRERVVDVVAEGFFWGGQNRLNMQTKRAYCSCQKERDLLWASVTADSIPSSSD